MVSGGVEGPPVGMATASVFREATKQHEGDDAVVATNMDALEWLRKQIDAVAVVRR